MKLSDILFERAEKLWDEAVNKKFVTEMAEGILDAELFRNYMLQDFLYLKDYIEILEMMQGYTEDEELLAFLTEIISETKSELVRVHRPNLEKTGITEDEISSCVRSTVILEYVAYMRKKLEENGIAAGLTALLQCSWVYAYIAEKFTEKYPEEIKNSPYKHWFDSYRSEGYIETNCKWIEFLDKKMDGLDSRERDRLSDIFNSCARYENLFWDELYDYEKC
ncbi:hypothetical protein QYZ88_013025 [Lachnospiraceae bacterium C1.1]|nr:hypothetical protein [Lachnospiraceae bacterium C1.1]